MEDLTLTKPSQPPCADSQSTIDSLISEWVAKLAINVGAALDAKTQSVYCSIWLEGLSDLSPAVLLAAFRKTLRECPYWPVKVADIRKHVSHAVSNATVEAAERAWQLVFEIRRCHWSADLPEPFNRALGALSEHVRCAARASGIFREFTASEYENGALHTWAKKRFIESFIAYSEREQDKFLLPDGEIKKLISGVAETRALPVSEIEFHALHERGLEYAEQIRDAVPLLAVNHAVAARGELWGSEELRGIAYRSLGEKETSPALTDMIRAQKAALAERGYAVAK